METLYRFFDKNDRLLYIGISSNWTQRLNQHYKRSTFFTEIDHATFEHYQSREEVEAAEKLAISTEGAIYNKTHNPFIETSYQHFRKIKFWLYSPYSNIETDEKHTELIKQLRRRFISDSNWIRKNSAPVAFYLLLDLPETSNKISETCEQCLDLYHADFIESWARRYEKGE